MQSSAYTAQPGVNSILRLQISCARANQDRRQIFATGAAKGPYQFARENCELGRPEVAGLAHAGDDNDASRFARIRQDKILPESAYDRPPPTQVGDQQFRICRSSSRSAAC